jgi:hypothetical protein
MTRKTGVHSEGEWLKVIDQRDAAEAALADAYSAIVEEQPQWSNCFGYRDPVEEIDDSHRVVTESERRLVDAAAAALSILREDRDALVESSTVADDEGAPDLSTLDDLAKPYVAEYDRVIAQCEDALAKAGAR